MSTSSISLDLPIHITENWCHCWIIIHWDIISVLMILKSAFHLTVCHATHLYSCCLLSFDEVQSWMASSNSSLTHQTKFLLLGTPQQLKKFDRLKSLKLGDSTVQLVDAACKLGVVLSSTTSLTGHVNSNCKSSYMLVCDIRRIRSYVPMSVRIALAKCISFQSPRLL